MISFKEFLERVADMSLAMEIEDDARDLLEELKGRDCSCSTSKAHIEEDIHPTIKALGEYIECNDVIIEREELYEYVLYEHPRKNPYPHIKTLRLEVRFKSRNDLNPILASPGGRDDDDEVYLNKSERGFLIEKMTLVIKCEEAIKQALSRAALDL